MFCCVALILMQWLGLLFGWPTFGILRLLALHSLWSALVVAVVLRGRLAGPSLSEMSQIGRLHEEFFDLFGIVILLDVGIWEKVAELLRDLRVEGLWKFDVEGDVEVSSDEGVASAWHTLVGDHHHVRHGATGVLVLGLGLDDLSRACFDDDVAVVQMLDLPRESGECLVDADFLDDEQVGSLALEEGVVLLLHDEVHVSGFSVWCFVCHATEGDLLVVLHSLLDVDFDDLALVLGAGAGSLTAALAACSLDLRDHARSQLSDLEHDTLSAAGFACLDFADDDLAVDGELDGLALVKILERDLDGVLDAGSLARSRRTTTSAASEEHGEKILAASRRWTILADALQTVLVVCFSLIRVA
mmetsp:Transcript_4949/g.13088  ORF Transcript_4949/g.13088 Transcript_4949/m.13088 type:complete len:359 (+) Transcript_4949:320-1396(+)